jgi:hypothetical protein
MRAMRRALLTAALLAGLALASCGGDDKEANKDCQPGSDPALEAAARAHVDKIIVGAKPVDADKIEVDACRTSDDEATATITVLGVKDKAVKDQRHQATLEKRNGKWAVVRDLDTQRCREGHGHKGFSSLQCT